MEFVIERDGEVHIGRKREKGKNDEKILNGSVYGKLL